MLLAFQVVGIDISNAKWPSGDHINSFSLQLPWHSNRTTAIENVFML